MVGSSAAYEGSSFQKFLNWSNQKEILGKEILALIKPSYKSLLDVGAGNGDLTESYIGLFEKTLLLEPAQQYYERLRERFPEATVAKTQAEDFRSDGSQFDLIVASHVFYYVAKPREVINHLFTSLNEGGRLVMVMVDRNCGYRRFVDYFYNIISEGKVDLFEIQWGEIVTYLATQSISPVVKDLFSQVNAPSIDDFLSLNDFIFNIDVSHIPGTVIDEMRTFLKDYLTSDGLSIDTWDKVIVVEK